MHSFNELREEYRAFNFTHYEKSFEDGLLKVIYHYEIIGLENFETKWTFKVGSHKSSEVLDDEILDRFIFSLGMAEAISYYKCACPKKLFVECGALDECQIEWWRKLFYNGLGEFLYVNNIEVSEDDLVVIRANEPTDDKVNPLADDQHVKGITPIKDEGIYEGTLVPVGGGKDSVVSLEVLKGEKIIPYLLNPLEASKKCVEVCDHCEEPIEAKRVLDKKIIEMNQKGYLNGHIPFSAVLAFSTVITAYLNGIKYIALSNESSANESTVKGIQRVLNSSRISGNILRTSLIPPYPISVCCVPWRSCRSLIFFPHRRSIIRFSDPVMRALKRAFGVVTVPSACLSILS